MSTTYPNLTSTNFPDAIDDFDNYLDPQIEEMSLINQYYNFIEQNNLTSANQILIDNPSLIPKIVNAARLNQLRDGLIAVENYCRDNTPYYATCSTGTATTTARVATTTNGNFVLTTGAQVNVKFTYGNTASNAITLNVDNTGAKTIYRSGTSTTRYYWQAGELITFVYDGTYWVMQGKSTASTTYYGVTKLETSSTSTSTSTALTPSSLHSFDFYTVSGLPIYSSSNTYAVGDKVRYSNSMYVCNTAITSGESWTSAHWTVLPTLQDQIENISSNLDIYATCRTSASNSTKKATTTNGNLTLKTGVVVNVLFYFDNTSSSPTLNVDGTGDKDIIVVGNITTIPLDYFWRGTEIVTFVYNGASWVMLGRAPATTSYYGVTKLETSSTSTSTSTALTPSSLHSFDFYTVSGLPIYSSSNTYAVGDKVRYRNSMYVCNTAITSGESWTSAHWTVLPTLQDQIENISSNLYAYVTCSTSPTSSEITALRLAIYTAVQADKMVFLKYNNHFYSLGTVPASSGSDMVFFRPASSTAINNIHYPANEQLIITTTAISTNYRFAGKFEAIYGTTTNSQLTQAYNADLDIVLKYNDPDNLTHYYMAQLSRLIQEDSSNVWYFSCIDGTTLYTFSCNPSSLWSVTKKTITTT